MKSLTVIFLFCTTLFCSSLSAQNLQLNSQILGLNSKLNKQDRELNPYPHQIGLGVEFHRGIYIAYRKLLPNNQSFRASTTGFENPFSLFNLEDEKDSYLDFRIGYEKHFPLANKLKFYIGAEAGITTFSYFSSSRTSRITDFSITGITGLKYRINKRLSVFAETGYGVDFQKQTFREQDDNRVTQYGLNIQFGILFTINKYKKKKN